MKVNIPGRVIEFYKGGGAFQAYDRGAGCEDQDYHEGEWQLFTAVDRGQTIRTGQGGFYVRAELSPGALGAARYWAEALVTAAHGDATWERDAHNDLRAAQRLLAHLPR